VLAAVNTVASLFYYLRWIVPALSHGTGDKLHDGDRGARGVAYTAAAVSIGLGVAGGPVLAVLDGPLAASG
jgi:NADH-quinone oxidoreductase subunit N